MSDTKIQDVVKQFKVKASNHPRMVDWMITWDIGLIDQTKLWPLLERAFPHKVIANEKYYGKYNKLGTWIDNNCTGMWTHSNIAYLFEFEEDAMAFKLRWL